MSSPPSDSPTSIEALSQQVIQELVPRTSKQQYEKEWDKLLTFLKDHDAAEVDEKTLQAFFADQSKRGYAPTTLRRQVSIIKKMTTVKEKVIPDAVWDRLNYWLNNLSKGHKPAASDVFTREELDQFMETLDESDPVQLQEKVLIIVAFMGGVRRQEHHDLQWEDFTFNLRKKEVFIRLKKTKGNSSGRCFAITDYESYRILSKYKESILKKSKLKELQGPFYLIWNKPASCWNTGGNGRGRDWFQKIPKKCAQFLKKDKKKFSHHSF